MELYVRAVLKSKKGLTAIIDMQTVEDPAGGSYLPAKFISRRPGTHAVVMYDLDHIKNDTAYYVETDEDPKNYAVFEL